jgi:hypothetical protein
MFRGVVRGNGKPLGGAPACLLLDARAISQALKAKVISKGKTEAVKNA